MIAAETDDACSPHLRLLFRRPGHQLSQRFTVFASGLVLDGGEVTFHARLRGLLFILRHYYSFRTYRLCRLTVLRLSYFIRLYFFNTSTTRSPGKPKTRMPSAPVIVRAESIALTTASSVA